VPYVPFATRFPELAREETRSIRTFEEGVETRAYLFTEMFCDERGCDCRRVFIWVLSDEHGASQPRATIAWGWEPDSFYRTWAKFPLDDADLNDLRGPALPRLTEQSDEAPQLLDRFRTLLEDESYASRIVRHYQMFRERVELEEPSDEDAAAPSLNRAARRRLAKEARTRRRR
jgi:hypothetical protein